MIAIKIVFASTGVSEIGSTLAACLAEATSVRSLDGCSHWEDLTVSLVDVTGGGGAGEVEDEELFFSFGGSAAAVSRRY